MLILIELLVDSYFANPSASHDAAAPPAPKIDAGKLDKTFLKYKNANDDRVEVC